MPLDLCSISQGETRFYSFLSQAFGLIADIGESNRLSLRLLTDSGGYRSGYGRYAVRSTVP